MGPRAKALAVALKHRLGVSYGKVSEVLQDAFGLQVSRSGWCQSGQKFSKTTQPVYEALLEMIRQSSVVHADETGWQIGTLASWLWVFTNREATVYVIHANHSSDVVIDVLGQEFKGILALDCFLAYDEQRVSHLLTDLKEMKESKSGRAFAICASKDHRFAGGFGVEGAKIQPGSVHFVPVRPRLGNRS